MCVGVGDCGVVERSGGCVVEDVLYGGVASFCLQLLGHNIDDLIHSRKNAILMNISALYH